MGATLIGPAPYGRINLGNTLSFVRGNPVVVRGNLNPSNVTVALRQAQPQQAIIYRDAQGYYRIIHQGTRQGTQTCIMKQRTGGRPQALAPNTPRLLVPGDRIFIGKSAFIYHYAQGQSGSSGFGVVLVIFLILAAIAASQNATAQNTAGNTSQTTITQNTAGNASHNSSVQSTLATFCTNLTTGKYQAAYDQLSAHVQSQESKLQFITNLQQDKPIRCQGTAGQEKGASASATLNYTFASGKTKWVSIHLIKEGDTWKIGDSTPY